MRTDAARRSRAYRDHFLFCVVFHAMKRVFLAAGGGGVTGVAYDRRRGPTRDGAEFLPSGFAKKEHRLPPNLRGRGRGRVPTGDGIRAIDTRRGVRVPGSSRMRREGKHGVDAGADDNHLPTNLRVAGMEEISGTRCTPSEWKGRRVISWTLRPWAFS